MNISIIVAVSINGVIGKDNKLPWHLPADMAFFKEKTNGHCVITGRKNYESIPEKYRPLPNRTNIVITRQKDYKAPGAIVVHSIEEAMVEAQKTSHPEIFIIGGAEIYNQALALDFVDTIYLTQIHYVFEGDTYFPELHGEAWHEIANEDFVADEKNVYAYSFNKYIRAVPCM